MKLEIKHYSQNEILVLCLFICPYVLPCLLECLSVPTIIKYFFDVVWAFLLLTMLTRRKNTCYSEVNILKYIVLLFFTYTVLNYILHYQSIFFYLWGFRNIFRGFVLFFSVIYYLKTEDALDCISLLDKLFYINAVIASFQFFILGYKQDNLGGIFGVQSGCNGALNIFLGIMLIIYYVKFLNKTISTSRLCINFMIMVLIAAAAEIKYFYIEFVVILAFASLITEFSFKKLFLIVGAFIVLRWGYIFFLKVFPDTDLSLNSLISYMQSDAGYSVSGGISRGTFITYINKRFLTHPLDRILGLGLGNCDYATGISFLTTPFYLKNGYTRYDWMSSSLIYLEHGFLGSILYILVVILNAIFLLKKRHTLNQLSLISILTSILFFLVLFYNNSLKVESVYMIFFILALPWTSSKRGGISNDSF